MQINEKNIKLMSTIGPRAAFGLGVTDLAKNDKEIIVVTCDVSTSAGLDRFRKNYPDQFIDLGIAEQNMIGVATGISREDFKVITTTFAPFQTMRCCEQIKVNLGYMKEKITMVGLASGLVLGNLGFTHCCIEDIGILRSIPNITIISPSDSLETTKAIEKSLKHNRSCYIRITGSSNNPIINPVDYSFEIGKSITLKEGKDVSIISCGAILDECLKAAYKLEEKNISTEVINMHTIKPLDEKKILEVLEKSKVLVSVEEHNVIGGLGSAISELVSSSNNKKPLLRLGINDNYAKSGSYDFLKNYYGLSSDMILKNILNIL